MPKDTANNLRLYKVETKKVTFRAVRRVDRINNGTGKKDSNKKNQIKTACMYIYPSVEHPH